MSIPIKWLLLFITTSYHLVASWIEKQKYRSPGELIDIGGYKLHLLSKGRGDITVVVDHSLGGIDGYFIIEEIAKFARVCIYDRAGYGWSEMSRKPRCSESIVKELDLLLTRANIHPPYLLVGDSFGSYNVRLYAHYFPDKVVGIVLTDGLHEKAMLKMPLVLKMLKLFFISGFAMSIMGAILGIVRLLGTLGIFELIKKELRQFSVATRQTVKRSFYHPKHWLTMLREMWNLDRSGYQVSQATNLGDIPIVSIKASTFFKRAIATFYVPVKAADKLRDKMHSELLELSTNCEQIHASKSSHFVWVDEPEIIIEAIKIILQKQ